MAEEGGGRDHRAAVQRTGTMGRIIYVAIEIPKNENLTLPWSLHPGAYFLALQQFQSENHFSEEKDPPRKS